MMTSVAKYEPKSAMRYSGITAMNAATIRVETR
jgi:hypothetical protein